jgi:hypothetical protein
MGCPGSREEAGSYATIRRRGIMAKRRVLGVLVANRVVNASEVQQVLTEYGCNIKTRLGLHETDATSCSPSGLLLLELFGDETAQAELEAKLNNVKGLQIQKMVFDM